MACYSPIVVKVTDKEADVLPGRLLPERYMLVGCGSCLGCRTDQAREWAIRIYHEASQHRYSWFLTLTYDDEHLPADFSLDPGRLRAFFKALRKRERFSYFACGEYGGQTFRPHYHAVLFGPALLDRFFHRMRGDFPAFRSPILESCWSDGFVEVGPLTPASASYVSGYVRKKVQARQNSDLYDRVSVETGEIRSVEPEFSRMSLRPAIGRRFIERWWPDVYPKDLVSFDGGLYKPPRFYDRWADAEHEPPCEGGCAAHQYAFRRARAERLAKFEEVAQARLDARAVNHAAVLKLHRKDGSL